MARVLLSLWIPAKTREVQLDCNSLSLIALPIFLEPLQLVGNPPKHVPCIRSVND